MITTLGLAGSGLKFRQVFGSFHLHIRDVRTNDNMNKVLFVDCDVKAK